MVAVDIGGSHISSLEITNVLEGEIKGHLCNHKVPVHKLTKSETLDAWAQNINSSIKTSTNFDGNVAIAFPGPFDYNQGIIEPHPNGKFRQLEGTNIKNEIVDRLISHERIYFQNDATSFGVGEYYYGQKETSPKIIALTIGSGIGSAFIDRGKAVENSKSIPEGGEVYNLCFKGLIADDFFSTRWFVNECDNHGIIISGVKEFTTIGSEKLLNDVFSKFVHNFNTFFLPIATHFGANRIILGGNITKAWKHFGAGIDEFFKRINIDVVLSQLGEKAICLGVARSMYNEYSL